MSASAIIVVALWAPVFLWIAYGIVTDPTGAKYARRVKERHDDAIRREALRLLDDMAERQRRRPRR